MEIALILVLVAALAVFLFIKSRKPTALPPRDAAPSATQGPERPARAKAPTTNAESPIARRKSLHPPEPSSPGTRDAAAGDDGAGTETPHHSSLTSAGRGAGHAVGDRAPSVALPVEPGQSAEDLGAHAHAPGEADGARLGRPTPTGSSPPAGEQAPLLSDSGAPADGSTGSAEEGFVSVAPESALDSYDYEEAPPPLVRSPSPPDASRKLGLLSLRRGLKRSRESDGFFGRLKALLGGRKTLDPNIAEAIEEILLTSDVGVRTTDKILERIKQGMSRGDLNDDAKVFKTLREEAHKTLAVEGTAGALVISHRPTVVLFVGVNGAGKTTTIGKLAQKLTAEGRKVMLSAGDTFRAAAVEQLQAWGERSGCEVVTGKEGADPSSVLFDAISAAKNAGVDVLLADTAGRLHTKANLMLEMTKIQKVAGKALDGAPHETLLVIDSTNGQNALAQAREFKEALPLTGLVLTKLDGTAKGGVVLGICDDLRVPVRYVGVGERAEDLHAFEPAAFVEALLGAENEVIAA